MNQVGRPVVSRPTPNEGRNSKLVTCGWSLSGATGDANTNKNTNTVTNTNINTNTNSDTTSYASLKL